MILYIDTSSSYLYSAIYKDEKILSSIDEKLDKELSKKSLFLIKNMFDKLNITPNDIDKIMVVNGPGSFTGIRVGLTIAKTFAWSMKKEIISISSLDAMAVSNNTNNFKIPLIDARRGYVYASIRDKDNNIILEDSYISIDKLKEHLKDIDNYDIITNDNIDYFDNLVNYTPNFKEVIDFYKDKKSENIFSLNPKYLKKTEAEEKYDNRN